MVILLVVFFCLMNLYVVLVLYVFIIWLCSMLRFLGCILFMLVFFILFSVSSVQLLLVIFIDVYCGLFVVGCGIRKVFFLSLGGSLGCEWIILLVVCMLVCIDVVMVLNFLFLVRCVSSVLVCFLVVVVLCFVSIF